jgi:hypothetical protein
MAREMTAESIKESLEPVKALLMRCKAVHTGRAEGVTMVRADVSTAQGAIRERMRTIEREGVLLRQLEADCRAILNEVARVR